MKNLKPLFFISLSFTLMAIMAFTNVNDKPFDSLKSSSGPPSGYSNDPAGGNKNCTNCHSGSVAEQQEGWISSDIPETGYLPANTYTITATAIGAGYSKFGFQISAQNSTGDILGTLVNTGSETKLISGTSYITHTSEGLSGQDSKVWSFDWTAPESGSGEVVFYGAFNLSNNNGSTSGDEIKISTLRVDENTSAGSHSGDIPDQFLIYPNPAREYIFVNTPEEYIGFGFIIYDQSGKQVKKGLLVGNITTLSTEHLKAGVYYFQVDASKSKVIRFIKK